MFDTPSPASAPSPLDDYIQPNLGHGLRIWWAYYWPTFLIATLIGIVGGAFLRIAWERVLLSGNFVIWGNRILTYAPGYIISFFTIRYVLGKKFHSFCVALLPPGITSGSEPLPRTFSRTIRVWWAFSWRVFVGRLGGYLTIGLLFSWFIGLFRPDPIFAVVFFFLLGVAIEVAVSLYVIYSAILDEQFGDFRVALLPRKDVAPATTAVAPAPPAPLSQ